jgi:hypothetical protein
LVIIDNLVHFLGFTAETAIDCIHPIYGSQTSVTEIINQLKEHKKAGTLSPNLRRMATIGNLTSSSQSGGRNSGKNFEKIHSTRCNSTPVQYSELHTKYYSTSTWYIVPGTGSRAYCYMFFSILCTYIDLNTMLRHSWMWGLLIKLHAYICSDYYMYTYVPCRYS